MKNKLKVGQIVYGEPRSNAARYSKELKEFTVVSLGNKYFILKNEHGSIMRNKFSYETMQEVSEYSSDWQIFLDKKEIQDRIDRPIVLKSISDKLSNLSVDELKILDESLYLK